MQVRPLPPNEKTGARVRVAIGLILAAWIVCPSCVAQGPVLYTRGIMHDITPEDAPQPGEDIAAIEMIACRGESEPFSLGVYATADGAWTIEVSDLELRADPAETIAASAVEVSLLSFGETPGHLGKGARTTDWVLDVGARSLHVAGGQTRRLWLAVHVPNDAAPGLYEGSFALKEGEGNGTVTVPLRVDVLPVNLEPVPDVQFALLWTVAFGQYHDEMTRAQRRPAALDLYRELRQHGMTCIAPKCSDWPYKSGQFEGLQACIEAAMQAGLEGPVVWHMASLINGVKGCRQFAHYDGKCDNWSEARDLAHLTDIVTDVRRQGEANGWPEVVFCPADEPGTQTDDLAIRALRLGTILPKGLRMIHDLGARGATTMTEPVDDKHNRQWVQEPDELRRQWDMSRPDCQVRIYGYGYPQGTTGLAFEKADCARRGHEMWFYHNPSVMEGDRHQARMFFGMWGWLVGADGLTAWTYPGGRTIQWELVRDGIDDAKYLAILARLIEEKKGSATDLREAQAFLDELRTSIELDEDGYLVDWQSVDFAAFKRRTAELIRKLAQ